ncbi:hypothetical protein [uncultured Roseovarius sp.]|uniref:hypothetical protein n=1 Tax=uncultured Roseovarius sp. TaxID=293344 RepID=UPI0026239C9D|nr:hypothetical protein [uncultured Roseovarius sp.]
MSNYDQWRDSHNFSRGAMDTGSTGSGLLWLFAAIAVLGVLILVGSLGGGSTSVEHPGGAGADPIVVPVEPDAGAGATSSTGAESAGTVPIE